MGVSQRKNGLEIAVGLTVRKRKRDIPPEVAVFPSQQFEKLIMRYRAVPGNIVPSILF